MVRYLEEFRIRGHFSLEKQKGSSLRLIACEHDCVRLFAGMFPYVTKNENDRVEETRHRRHVDKTSCSDPARD